AIRLLRERGIKIGMARLMWIRPFPSEDLRTALRGVKAVGVVETNLGLGGSTYGGIPSPGLATGPYHPADRPLATPFPRGVGGRGGEPVPAAEFGWLGGKVVRAIGRGGVEKPTPWVGFEE